MKIITRTEAIESGLKRYYTGEPCKRGHNAERFTISYACVECNKEAQDKVRADIKAKRR